MQTTNVQDSQDDPKNDGSDASKFPGMTVSKARTAGLSVVTWDRQAQQSRLARQGYSLRKCNVQCKLQGDQVWQKPNQYGQ